MKLPFSRNAGDSADPPPGQQSHKGVDLHAEFRSLWTVSQFFSVLQRLQLQPERGRLVDLSGIGTRLEESKVNRRAFGVSKMVELQRDLTAARNEIYDLDATIPVGIMRRFFEKLGRFDRAALGEVIGYYLAKPRKTADDRDKLDLLATRFGSYLVESQTDAQTWRSVDGLASQLSRIHPHGDDAPLSTRARAADDLREMREVVFDIRTFGDLIERKVVTRLRDYKLGLGENFYAPSILSEVVEINVAVHNKFQELYGSEMVRLKLEADRLDRLQQDTSQFLPPLESQRALSELGSLTVRMQQLLQEVKKDIADRVIVDRDARVSVEEDGVPLRSLVESCEETLRQTSELVKSLHHAFLKVESKGSGSR